MVSLFLVVERCDPEIGVKFVIMLIWTIVALEFGDSEEGEAHKIPNLVRLRY